MSAPSWWSITIPAAARKSGDAVRLARTDSIAFPVELADGSVRLLSRGRRPVALRPDVQVRPASRAEMRPVEVH